MYFQNIVGGICTRMYRKRVIGDKPEWIFLKFSVFFTITALSVNIFHPGDKFWCKEFFSKNTSGDLLPPPSKVSGQVVYNFCNISYYDM